MNRTLLAPYGLKFNPFATELPAEAQPAPLLRKLLAQFSATGLPAAMIHHQEPDSEASR